MRPGAARGEAGQAGRRVQEQPAGAAAQQPSLADKYFLEEIWRTYGRKAAREWIQLEREGDCASQTSETAPALSSDFSSSSSASTTSASSFAGSFGAGVACDDVHAAREHAPAHCPPLHPVLKCLVDGAAPAALAGASVPFWDIPVAERSRSGGQEGSERGLGMSGGGDILSEMYSQKLKFVEPTVHAESMDRSGLMYTDAAHLVSERPAVI